MGLTAPEIQANSIFIITEISITQCSSGFMKQLFSSRIGVQRLVYFIITFRMNPCEADLDNIV